MDSLKKEASPSLLNHATHGKRSATLLAINLSSPNPKNPRNDLNINSATGSSTNSTIPTYTLSEEIRNNRYGESSSGPFAVHIQQITDRSKKLDPSLVGSVLYKLKIPDVMEVKKIGFSKVAIFFSTKESANSLVEDSRLTIINLEAFIPLFLTSRKGIIRDIPSDLTIDEILKHISCPYKIITASRFKRKINNEFYPTRTVCLTFEGQKIPKHVSIFYTKFAVSAYIPRVSQCHNCFRFGHISINCKSVCRCVHCGNKGHIFTEESCHRFNETSTCANCKGNHRADSHECPKLLLQKRIREIAARQNISLSDAREILGSNNFFSLSSFDDFPPLFSSSNHSSPPSSPFSSPTPSISYTKASRKHINYPSLPNSPLNLNSLSKLKSNLKSSFISPSNSLSNVSSSSPICSLLTSPLSIKNTHTSSSLLPIRSDQSPSKVTFSDSTSSFLHPSSSSIIPSINPSSLQSLIFYIISSFTFNSYS